MSEEKKNPSEAPKLEAGESSRPRFISFGLPSYAGRRARKVFLFGALALLIFSISLPVLVRRAIHFRQERLEENSIWNAIRALKDGDESRAEAEVEKVLKTTIGKKLEGDALNYLAPYYNELATELFAPEWSGEWASEGRAVSYKALRHYHGVPRALEYLDPWLQLEQDYSSSDFGRFLQVFEIVTSHSLTSNSLFDAWIQDNPDRIGRSLRLYLPPYARLREGYYNWEPSRVLRDVTFARRRTDQPDLKIATNSIFIRSYMAIGERDKAIEMADRLGESFPDRLEPRALKALARQGWNARRFVDSLPSDSGWQTINFSQLRAAPTEYRAPRAFQRRRGGTAILRLPSAAELDLGVYVARKLFYLVASGTDFLDVYPILLISLDGGEIYPLYIDSATPEIFPVHLPLTPGGHTIRFEFLNDYAETVRGKNFNRDVHLLRIVLPGGGR